MDEFVGAGLDVDFSVEGDLNVLPSATGLALYRLAQESMANIVKHSDGRDATVRVQIGADTVRLSVENAHPGPIRSSRSDGLGIAGMRERASLVGGTLNAGPCGTGWSIVAELPNAAT